MRDQSVRDAAFSTTCARCSGRIFQLASFCPHCGARLASMGGAPLALHEHHGSSISAARFEPPMRTFAQADFEGDLDAPADGVFDSPSTSPDGPAHLLARVRALLGGAGRRGWGVKSRVGLILVSCVVVFGGFAALHRYDGPSVTPVVEQRASTLPDRSMASNDTAASILGRPANDMLRAPGATGQGAADGTLDTGTPPIANADAARTPPGGAGVAQGKHRARGGAHVRSRAHAHPYPKKRRGPPPNLYLH